MRAALFGVGLIVATTAVLYVLGETAPVRRAPVEVEISTDARD